MLYMYVCVCGTCVSLYVLHMYMNVHAQGDLSVAWDVFAQYLYPITFEIGCLQAALEAP